MATEREATQSALETAKRNLDRDPHLANFVLRDLPILEELGCADLSWAIHKSGDCHKNDVLPITEKLEKYLSYTEQS